jgi:DNA-binding response OmpR family regulator
MHVLVLEQNQTRGLAQALQLSRYGLIVETVPTVDEAERRLSAISFDAVLWNVPFKDVSESHKLETIRRIYPNTQFFSADGLDDFLRIIRKTVVHKLR